MDTTSLSKEIAQLYKGLIEEEIEQFAALMIVQYFIQAKVQFSVVMGENPGFEISQWLNQDGEQST